MSTHPSRRALLKAVPAAPLFIPAAALGLGGATPPSDRITLALIGSGGRGRFVLSHFLKETDVQVTAVCDCFADRRDLGRTQVNRHYENSDCVTYRFHEEVLDRKDIDAVLIATGDRWHSVLSVLAARAGKDIYCEKPISLTIAEGQSLIDTIDRYGTVWQCGMQRRSIAGYQFVVDVVRSGRIGRLHTITTSLGEPDVWLRDATSNDPPAEPAPAPEVMDYDRWLGQSPWVPYSRARVEFWRLNWDTSGGSIVDMGPHFLDLVQRAHGNELEFPIEYEGEAEYAAERRINNIPASVNVRARYADGVQIVINNEPKAVRFDGDKGWLQLTAPSGGWETIGPETALKGLRVPEGNLKEIRPHIRNFLECIRSRKEPIANARVAQRAHVMSHCANLCLRLGRKVRWDHAASRFVGDEDANRLLSRTMRAPWRV